MQEQPQADESVDSGKCQTGNNGARDGKVPSKWSRQAYESALTAAPEPKTDPVSTTSQTEARSLETEPTGAPEQQAGEESVQAPSHDYRKQNDDPAAVTDKKAVTPAKATETPAAVPGTLIQRTIVGGVLLVIFAACAAYWGSMMSNPPEPPQADPHTTQPLGQALEPINRQIEENPRKAEAYYRRAEIYYDYDQPENALTDLGKAIEINPKYWLAYALRADVATFQNRNAQALADARLAVKEAPDQPWSWEKLATVQNRMGHFDLGVQAAEHALKLNPRSSLAMGEMASSMEGENRYTEAVTWLTRQEDLWPNPSERSLASRGLEKYHMGDFDGCIADENAAIKAIPHRGTELIIRAYAEAAKGDMAQAEADVAQGLTEERNPARGHRLAADLYRLCNNFDKAISEYSIAISLFPGGTTNYRNRGVEYYRAGQLNNALDDLRTAATHKPTSTTLSYLALIEQKLGQTADADADIAKAEKVSQPLSLFYCNRADILLQRGKLTEALADAQKALAMDKRNADAYDVLGKIYKAQSQDAQAQTALAKAQKLGFPNSMPPAGW